MFTVYLHIYFHSDFVQELVISQTVGGIIQVKLYIAIWVPGDTHWLEFYIFFSVKKTLAERPQVHTDWPSYLHSKGVFFVKKSAGPLPSNTSQPLLDQLTCGDVHPNILGQIIMFRQP